jgi:hypothetical protein
MSLVANRMAVGVLAALLSLGADRSAAAQSVNVQPVTHTVYRSKTPANPPASRAEIKGKAPSAEAVWVPGFWDLLGDRNYTVRAGWVWVHGRWIEPPVPHAQWDPGHWGWSDNWYTWIPAHWVVPGRHGYPSALQSDLDTEREMSAP